MRLLYSFILLTVFSTAGLANPAPESFAPLVEKLLPTVVNVSTVQTIPAEQIPNFRQFPQGSPFEEFNEFFREFEERGLAERKANSLGSGVIVDKRGYIITNNHVISNAEEITVTLSDNTVYPAEIIGRDGKTDLALLKIEVDRELPYAEFGDSDEVKVGEWVIAIGNPFGLGGTVTAGIISAVARDIHAGPFDEFLQTDAAINRGNSGGPMFDINGKIIGINTAIFSPNGIQGGNVGIGFAVPSSLAEPVVEQLIKYGKIKRGWLGVKIQTVTEDIAESIGLEENKGALVVSVTEGSPADKGGIKAGDILLEFDGQEIPEMRKLPRMVAETEIGKNVKIKLLRNNKPMTVFVDLGELKEQTAQQKTEKPEEKEMSSILKMELAPLTDEYRKNYSIPNEVEGLIVLKIHSGSKVIEYGMMPSDVIVEVNYKTIKTVEDFTEALKQAKDQGKKKALVMVYRKGSGMYFLTIPTDVD